MIFIMMFTNYHDYNCPLQNNDNFIKTNYNLGKIWNHKIYYYFGYKNAYFKSYMNIDFLKTI